MEVRRAVELNAVKTSERADSDVVTAHYAAELARMLVYDIFGNETYSRGLNVYTTIRIDQQRAAVESVRRHLITYDRRYGYRGPEDKIELGSADNQPKAIRRALATTASSPFMLPAVVLEANPKKSSPRFHPTKPLNLMPKASNLVDAILPPNLRRESNRLFPDPSFA